MNVKNAGKLLCRQIEMVGDKGLKEKLIGRIQISTRNSAVCAVGLLTGQRNRENVNIDDKYQTVPIDIRHASKLDERNYWMANKVVVEVKKKSSGGEYCGNTLHQFACGIQRFLREIVRAGKNSKTR